MTTHASRPRHLEPVGPTGAISDWLARQPGAEGFALIVPDNLDMLEIAAGSRRSHELRCLIGKRLAAAFGPDHVTCDVIRDGYLVALAAEGRPSCLRMIDEALRDITGIQLDYGRCSCAITARAGVVWADTLPAGEPELVQRKLVAAVVTAQRDHRSWVALAAHEVRAPSETEITAQLLCDLPAAIAENRLQLNAQDIVECAPRPDATHQVEILLQMRDRDGKDYPPSSFLPAAENSALIGMIDRWVLRRVLVDFAPRLQARPRLCVSINVSAPTLGSPDFPGFLAGVLRESGIDPRRVQLEITETSVIRDLKQATANVREARALGCRIALDDFGAGLSSYGYLQAFEPDCIKIDGGLIPNVVDPENVEAQIVRSIIRLAHRLGIEVVAEHVSSDDILASLRDLGIDKVQGFELGRPRPLTQLLGNP